MTCCADAGPAARIGMIRQPRQEDRWSRHRSLACFLLATLTAIDRKGSSSQSLTFSDFARLRMRPRGREHDNSYNNYYGYGYGGRDWKTYAARNNLACTPGTTFRGADGQQPTSRIFPMTRMLDTLPARHPAKAAAPFPGRYDLLGVPLGASAPCQLQQLLHRNWHVIALGKPSA